MKHTITLIALTFATMAFSQKEGQSFCDGDNSEGYFTMQTGKKIVLWYATYYEETLEGEAMIDGKTYKKYIQQWQDGSKSALYFREEGSRVLQYDEATKKDVERLDGQFKPGQKWKGIDCTYTLLSFDETLQTPICHYKNLMAIKAVYTKDTYIYYYLKGFGYVGATKDGKLISCAVPKLLNR